MCALAVAAGATYVARTATSAIAQMDQMIKKGLEHKGFGVVEILSQCPTHFGRYALGSGNPEKNLGWIRDICVSKKQSESMAPEELGRKIVTGEFICVSRPAFKGSTFIRESSSGNGA